MPGEPKLLRCAIYTRKSTEHGLELEFNSLVRTLVEVIEHRYRLPPWTAEAYAAHKYGHRLAAASEAFHVVGWSLSEIHDYLQIQLDPVWADPVCPPEGFRPWEPWPPNLVASLFLETLKALNSRGVGR